MRSGNKEGWCNFVPYPILMIGQVESGIPALSGLKTDSAQSVALFVSFSQPVRLAAALSPAA